jgi:nuclear GTP-binding protein
MEKSNPLSRKTLKQDAKRARRMMKLKAKAEMAAGGGMQIDENVEELQFTFMA